MAERNILLKRVLTFLIPAAVLFFIIILYNLRPTQPTIPVSEKKVPPKQPPYQGPSFEFHGINHLESSIEISSLRLLAETAPHELNLNETVNVVLPAFQNLNLDQNTPVTEEIPEVEVKINVPPISKPADASHLLFGLATTLKRLKNSLPTFKHWASGTNAQFVIIVETHDLKKKPTEPSVEEITELYRSNGIHVTLFESSEHYLDRYVSLLGALHDNLTESTQWTAIIDDDTFFPSMGGLLAMLARYDSNQPYYIGGISEDKWANENYGMMAFGGAGVFMSVALLQELRPHAETCVHLPPQSGDRRVAACVYRFSTAKLTWEHGLYQLDLHGDMTGFYEAVRPQPISVHHWKSAYYLNMARISAVSKICGPSCIFQKYTFLDSEGHSWHMTNGFSIVKYSYTDEEQATFMNGAMEQTWIEGMWNVPPYNLGPFKPRDNGKIQYMLELIEEIEPEAQSNEVGNVSTEEMRTMILYFVRRKDGVGNSIIRVTWQGS